MFTSILVPLDGSRFAEAALPTALQLVRASHARLHVVRAQPSPALLSAETPVGLDPRWLESVQREHAAYMKDVGERISARIDADCVTRLLEGMPAGAIAEYARAENVGLIVMTTHGRGGLSRYWLGSVADALVRRSETPVLLIRPPEDGDADAVSVTATNILVPLDGSELALGILPVATSFARAAGARITLLRVIPDVAVRGVYGLAPLPNLATEAVARANAELDELASTLQAQGVHATTAVVQGVDVGPAILDYAERTGADVIAIATHGRGGLGRAALGSVADKVIRGASVPVLSLRPQSSSAGSANAAA